MKIINLTQHVKTPAQKLVVEPYASEKEAIRKLLTFDTPRDLEFIRDRAQSLADIADAIANRYNAVYVLIGGAPFLMCELEMALESKNLIPCYSFSPRVVEEDGSGKKVSIFKHCGYWDTIYQRLIKDDEYENKDDKELGFEA